MSSDDEDGLPEWIANYRSPTQKAGGSSFIELSSSSDDDLPQPAAPPQEPEPEKRQSPAEDDRDEAGAKSIRRTASQVAAASAEAQAKPRSTSKRQKALPNQQKLRQPMLKQMLVSKGGTTAVESGAKPAAAPAVRQSDAAPATQLTCNANRLKISAAKPARGKLDAAAAAAAATVETAGVAVFTAVNAACTSSSAAAAPHGTAGGGAAAKAAPKVIAAPVPGEVPVMIPDKLSHVRIIAELPHLDGGATDLTGDSGAVGRVLVREEDGSSHMQFDLKGVVYDARHAQLASTLCVLNIGQTEAKVEAVMHSYLQLCRANPDEEEEENHKYFMDEDDDDMFQPAYARAAAGEEDAKSTAKKKPGAKKKAAGLSRVGGGVKKKPAKKPTAKKTAGGRKAAGKPRGKAAGK